MPSDRREPKPHFIRCPKCGAAILEPCRFPSGLAILPHDRRIEVAAYPYNAPPLTGAFRQKMWAQKQLLDRNTKG